jgi:hypothetical protein
MRTASSATAQVMTEELAILRDITTRLESAGIEYMLTGSVALACHAQPRMTRDIDLVVAFQLEDVKRIAQVLGSDYYVSEDAALEAVEHQSSFNAVHETTLIKVDFMVRKQTPYRLHEFTRRVRIPVADFHLWVVCKEDLILAKLDWAREALSERQLADVENLIATGCDLEYIKKWSAELNLTDMLTRVLP